MAKLRLNTKAPDFTLKDLHGKTVHLSDFQDSKHVVLILNRGFF